MIPQINSGNQNINIKPRQTFKGGPIDAMVSALQTCEVNPMLNVAVLDLSTAIVPRTIIEGQTNPYAGLEAFRRESSGLIINCMIPGIIVAGIAKMIAKPIMGMNSQMTNCWANEETINLISDAWKKNSVGKDNRTNIINTLKDVLNNTKGIDGDKTVHLSEFVKDGKFDKNLNKIADVVLGSYSKNDAKEIIKEVKNNIISQTHVSENIKIGTSSTYFSQSLEKIIENSPNILKDLSSGTSVKTFKDKAIKLVNAKSLLGLGVILPLALAAQPINRWITEKTSGKKGAPIYKDFADSETKKQTPEEKMALAKQKVISVSSMVGVALLSIMKKPNLSMLKEITQFKGIFPSMDQARIISTATFASRMAASQDKNDLREATVRDIATFSAFYFLGDYVAKGIASVIQKIHPDIKLINDLDKGEHKGLLKKIWHWTKDTALKTSDEIHVQKSTAELTEQATKYAKKLRGICQLGNIAFSLVALGLVIPHMNRKKTDLAREKELKDMGVGKDDIKKYYPAFEKLTPQADIK